MSDLISREEVLKLAKEGILISNDMNRYAREIINSIPTAEPKVGKWISVSSFEAFGGDEIYWEIRGNPTAFHYCSACKEQAYADELGNEILSKYCPNCGAKMERSE